MIEIRGWHGCLSNGTKRNPKAIRLDEIAKHSLVNPDAAWMFDGTVGEFAEKWAPNNFMSLWDTDKKNWTIFVSQHNSFNQR